MDDQNEHGEFTGWKIDQLDFPTFRIGLLAKLMDRLTIRNLSQTTNLTYAQWRVLSRLSLMPDGGTVRDIAALAWVDRAEVSRAVAALEALDLVWRKENPADRRMPILMLTSKGEVVHRDVLGQRIAFHENLLADLSTEERAVLDSLLSKIGERLLDGLGETGRHD